jgi:hypothetical protein
MIIPDLSLEFPGYLCKYREAGLETIEEERVCSKLPQARTSILDRQSALNICQQTRQDFQLKLLSNRSVNTFVASGRKLATCTD